MEVKINIENGQIGETVILIIHLIKYILPPILLAVLIYLIVAFVNWDFGIFSKLEIGYRSAIVAIWIICSVIVDIKLFK